MTCSNGTSFASCVLASVRGGSDGRQELDERVRVRREQLIGMDLVSMTRSRVEHDPSRYGCLHNQFARAIWVLVPKLPIYSHGYLPSYWLPCARMPFCLATTVALALLSIK